MNAPRAARIALVLLVTFYLCAAGWFCVLAPWSRYWATRVVPGAPLWLAVWLDFPALRGALSAFGVLHFAVAASWLNRGLGQESS